MRSGGFTRTSSAAISGIPVFVPCHLQLPLVFLPLALLAWMARKPKDDLTRPAFFLAGAIPFVLWTGGIGSATAWWAFLMLVLLLAGSALKSSFRDRAESRSKSPILLVAATGEPEKPLRGVGASPAATSSPGLGRGNGGGVAPATHRRTSGAGRWLRWRYVYDYRLPPGMLDVE